MRQSGAVIDFMAAEVETLEGWTRRGKTEARLVERAKIILLAHEGRTNQQIAYALDTRTARVSKWRQRFGAARLAGLGEAERSGKPAQHGPGTGKQVVALLDQPPPKGCAHWYQRLLTCSCERKIRRRCHLGYTSNSPNGVWPPLPSPSRDYTP